MRRRKKIKRNLEVVLTKGLIRFARTLPHHTGYRVFETIGKTAGLLLKKDRERAIENLSIAFPDMPHTVRAALVTAMFRTLGQNAYEFLNLPGSSKERLAGLVERVEGQEHLDRAYASGKGLIALTGHIGCWELLGAYFVSQGYVVNVIGRQLWEKRINEELIRIRNSLGYRTIDRDSGGKEFLRVLRAQGIVAVLIDQHTRVNGVYVPFFNRPAHTPSGVAKLALATKAQVLPLAIYMTSPGRHVIRILPAVEHPTEVADRDKQVEVLTERCSRAIEDLIRYDPKQWVWFHRRWRDMEKAELDYATVN